LGRADLLKQALVDERIEMNSQARLNVVFEDRELLVVCKPAGLVCHPTKGDEYSSLISRARLHLGGATAHMVHRLDRETSGIVVLAKTSQSARVLGKIWESRLVEKVYWALVWGHPLEDSGIIDAPLGKDETSCIAIKDQVRADGAPASTAYRVIKRGLFKDKPVALLEVRPLTGRKHQIRIHLQFHGHSLVGDKLYGGNELHYLAFVQGRLLETDKGVLGLPWQALHARRIAFPWEGRSMEFLAQPEDWFQDAVQNLENTSVSHRILS
jgi:23S rRNA pseudouridine1911/1915/1917 synthase